LEDNVCGEKDKRYNGILGHSSHERVQAEIFIHAKGILATFLIHDLCYNIPSDGSSAQIGSIHQTNAVKDTDSHNETTVNAVDNLPLFLESELALVFICA
jgi:hypothetical protein